ncbi:MAG: HAD family hydrolase [Micrococcales bacterium]|nr:HAD family hydrolase [Micrococcales bacterium]
MEPRPTTRWPVERVDGVLLDIDDTLVDTRRAFVRALEVLAARYLPHLGADSTPRLAARWLTDPGGHYGRYLSGELDYRAQRMVRANDLHATFGGPPLDEDAYAAWEALFETTVAAALTLHPDVPGLMAGLTDAGLPVGAVTNADVAAQTDKLVAVGLPGLPVLVGVDTLGVGKPDPRVFAEACRRLGTDPARTVYVGDELHLDAVAARAAGLVAVWLDRPGGRRVPVPDADIAAADVAVVHTLADLPAVVARAPTTTVRASA